MNDSRLYCALFVVCVAAGCQNPVNPVISDVSAVITSTLSELPVNEHIKTKELKVIKVYYRENGISKSYDVLFGPNPGTGEEAEGWYHTSNPTVQLERGFAYMAGDKPYGEIQEAKALTEGTTIIIQTLSGVKRIYLVPKNYLFNDKVRVQLNLAGGGIKEKTISTNKWRDIRYVQINAGSTDIDGPFNLKDAPPDVRSFVEYARQRARDARIRGAKK